jgi:hypothetical protein
MYIIDIELYMIAYKCRIIMRNPNFKMATTTEQLLRYELTEKLYHDLFLEPLNNLRRNLSRLFLR